MDSTIFVASHDDTLVEHLTHNPKIEGSNPVTEEKIWQKKFIHIFFGFGSDLIY